MALDETATLDGSDDLLVQVTWMYYADDMTQQEIADELALSRVAVSRMLQKARRDGVVRFDITRPRPLQHQLARRLTERFGLARAWVVRGAPAPEETLQRIGRRGAQVLQELLFPGCRVGVGWSSTVSYMAPYLQPPPEPLPVTISELAGSMLGENNPYNISAQMARVLGGTLDMLPVPAVVQSAAVRNVLLQERAIRAALENAARCDVAFVGLGDCGPQSTMLRTGYISEGQMEAIRRRGAVGEALLRYFTCDGEHLPTDLDGQIITLSWEALRAIPMTIAMVSGRGKVETTLGALRGGLINGLISDTETVQAVLAS